MVKYTSLKYLMPRVPVIAKKLWEAWETLYGRMYETAKDKNTLIVPGLRRDTLAFFLATILNDYCMISAIPVASVMQFVADQFRLRDKKNESANSSGYSGSIEVSTSHITNGMVESWVREHSTHIDNVVLKGCSNINSRTLCKILECVPKAKVIELGGCKIGGEIPWPTIKNLVKHNELTDLDLAGNDFTGEVVSSIYTCMYLTRN